MKLIEKLMFKIANVIKLEQLNYTVNKEKLKYEDNLLILEELKQENEELKIENKELKIKNEKLRNN